MSTRRRRRRKQIEERKPGPISRIGISRKDFLVIVATLILAGIPFCMGKYLEFNTPGPFDSAAYAYSAAHILEGAEIGVEEIPSARLGTLMVNLLGVGLFGFNDFGPKIIQMLMQVGALIVTFLAVRKAFGSFPAMMAVILASIFLSAPVIAKFGNVKEQYMVACMMMGIGSLMLYESGRKWAWALAAGALLAWAPLFKPTGVSAIGATALFVLAQPIFRNASLKQMAVETGLLLGGAALSLAPLFIWILGWNIDIGLPYEDLFRVVAWHPVSGPVMAVAGAGLFTVLGYVEGSRRLLELQEQAPIVFRYYGILVLPIVLAFSSIIIRLIRWILQMYKKLQRPYPYGRFVLLLGVWWLLDMAFVWISPRSYEQYYLPVAGSSALCAAYVFALYRDTMLSSRYRQGWVIGGLIGLVCMFVMTWPIFAGITHSPHSGQRYQDARTGTPERRRGFAQRFDDVSRSKQGGVSSWEMAGQYIRRNSQAGDRIYVWGWIPGIYLEAQRFSPYPLAFFSEMHVVSPSYLENMIEKMVRTFREQPPAYIVDTYKNHFPWNRPPLELWPRPLWPRNGQVPPEQVLARYQQQASEAIGEAFGEAESYRVEAMMPMWIFMTENYTPAETFGNIAVYRLRKNAPVRKGDSEPSS